MEPTTFTVTTFWLDWLLVPLLLVGAWLTARWAVADSRQASHLHTEEEISIPAWAFSIPLLIAALAWVIAGLGTLIKEDYWEMRVIFVAFALWTISCIFGSALLILGVLRKGKGLDTAGIANLIGLPLMSVLMVLPGLIDHSSPADVTVVGHMWFVLLAVSVGLLTGGTLLGFPYKFPRFPLGLGILFLFGWGLSEVAFSQASFPWLIRIWKLHLGLEYLDAFPISPGWQIIGGVKALAGIAAAATLLIASRLRRSRESAPG
jgi:hypothetical protein